MFSVEASLAIITKNAFVTNLTLWGSLVIIFKTARFLFKTDLRLSVHLYLIYTAIK